MERDYEGYVRAFQTAVRPIFYNEEVPVYLVVVEYRFTETR